MKRLLITLLFLFPVAGLCRAQGIVLTGRVMDSAGEPLTGAAVMVKGTHNGVVTDIDGQYRLECGAGDIIEVSYMGFRTQEYYVTNQTVRDFYLYEIDDELTGDVHWSFNRHSVYASLVMPHNPGNFKPGFTVGYFYNLSPLPRFLYRWSPVRFLFRNSSLSFNAGKPAWDEKAVFYPSFNKRQRLVYFYRGGIELYGGVGYYFYTGNDLKVRNGNVMWNAGLRFGSCMFTKSLGFDFSAGYNYFAGNKRLNHITLLRVSLYRNWRP